MQFTKIEIEGPRIIELNTLEDDRGFFARQFCVDEFEKEPAYKRKGVELNDTPSSEQLPSRATVSLDENEDVQLRSNNSFLHDNVD
mgnify:CR=1 FL=1